jgi:hypothetical protein
VLLALRQAFPSPDAVTLEELGPEELAKVDLLVLIDSRWSNSSRVRAGW